MGMDITMNEPPTPAEVRQAKLDADNPDYFRFNWSGMHVMVLAMVAAGVLVESDPQPKLPTWPPENTPADRKDLVQEALGEPTLEVKLTPAEQIRVRETRATWKKLLAKRSAKRGKVPAYKFTSNEGWIVGGDECTVIAKQLRAYAMRVTQADLDQLDREYTAMQKRLAAATLKPGEIDVLGNHGLGTTLVEYRAWILEWATFNAVAAKHKGYRVE